MNISFLLSNQYSHKTWQFYQQQHDIFIADRSDLIRDLEVAIRHKQLVVYIQPQFTLGDHGPAGGEILLRWHHQEKGFISPQKFIPLAEQSKLIFPITKFVIEEACLWLKDLKEINPDFYKNFRISVNISALDIAEPRLISFLQNTLFYHGIDNNKIMLEVTESAAANNAELFLSTIHKLKVLGFPISIDDFGTGYSSMQYLQTMEADEIKLDMAFIRDIDKNPTSQKIAKAIIDLAHSTGAHTLAEGIESEEELECLKRLKCQQAQGFYWSPAISLSQFEKEYIK